MSTAEKLSDELLPKDLARMALEASGNVVTDATVWAMDWLGKNPEWTAAHADAMARSWLQWTISTVVADDRRMRAGQSHKAGGSAGSGQVIPFQNALTSTINANYDRMMDSPLWGGKRIGDATPTEIRESAKQFELSGKSMTRKAIWQKLVADAAEKNGAGCNESIRNVLTAKTVEELWEASDVA